MKAPYFISIARLPEGDDLPLMNDAKTNMPLFYPTVYITTERRMPYSPLTQEKNLRNIMILYTWAKLRDIDIEGRYFHDEFLSVNECSDLKDIAYMRNEDLLKFLHVKKRRTKKKTKVLKLGDYPVLPDKKEFAPVANNTVVSRLASIWGYLDWLAVQRLSRIFSKQQDLHSFLSEKREVIKAYLKDNAPKPDKKPVYKLPMGINPAEQSYLFDIISPNSDRNPWVNPVIKIRNEVIVKLLFLLGMRRGEILCLKTQDIDYKTNRLFIAKRPDDPEDKRNIKPRQKTLPRMHPLASDFAMFIRNYVVRYRTTLRRGKVRKLEHDFVFVSVNNGDPLSVKSVNEMFDQLRIVPGIPKGLTPRVGRNTWNDRFSALADKNNLKEQREQLIRNYLMGWTKNSEMGQLYSRRHIIQSAIDYQAEHAEKWYNTNIATNQEYENVIETFYGGNDDLPDIPF